ncbi:MAG: hypothetical protein WA783_05445 [Phormidesmis sp.]
MFTLPTQGEQLPTVSPANVPHTAPLTAPSTASLADSSTEPLATPPTTPPPTAPITHTEPVRHMLFGSLSAVQAAIKQIHLHGYAEPNDWSLPMSTGRPNEVMAILTKRMSLGQ